jgi:hypothetical protein
VTIPGTLASGEATITGRLTVRAPGDYGTIRCYPSAADGEASIGFYRNSNGTVPFAGDFWAVGHNAYGPGDRSFGIGCQTRGLCLSIAPTGAVGIPGSLSVTGAATVGGLTTTDDVVINEGATTAVRYGRIMSTDQYHAIILRGDVNYAAPNYTVNGGQDATTFVQFGGNYRFRQVTNAVNTLLLEITPTFVSIPGSLRVGGYEAGIRPFVSCAIPAAGGIYWNRGQNVAQCNRTGTGLYTVTWTKPHPDGAEFVPQYCLLNGWGTVRSANRTSTSIELLTAQDSVGTLADRDIWFTLH